MMLAPSADAGPAQGVMIRPGTELVHVRRAGPGGLIEAYVLRVDLADRGVRVGLLYPGHVAAVETVSAMASAVGAFAAINGDFFNIGASGAPVGPEVADGLLLKAPQPRRALVVGVGVDGIARISSVRLRGTVDLPGGAVALTDLNDANPGYPPMLASWGDRAVHLRVGELSARGGGSRAWLGDGGAGLRRSSGEDH